jgi:flagellar biosynthesis GTPase FlhF
VAHFEGDALTFIWEICWTHPTSRDAPVSWVDVGAMDVLDVETGTNDPLTFKCIRTPFTCEPCLEIMKQQKLEAENKRLNAIEVAKLQKEQAERRKEQAEQMAKLQKEELERKRESRRQKEQAEQMAKWQFEEEIRKKEDAKKNQEDSKRREELLKQYATESLLDAAHTSSSELVSLHIQNGSDVNQRCNTYPHIGWTPLMLACINGSEKVVSMLLEAGAKTDYRTFNRETASQLAEHYKHPTIVDLINSYSSKAVAKP